MKEPAVPSSSRRRGVVRRLLRIGVGLAVSGAALVALSMWAPWRASGPADSQGTRLTFLERIVGQGSSDVEPGEALPMLVDVHGYGSIPELHGYLWRRLDRPIRLILPAGPQRGMLGRSWFPLERETLLQTVGRSAEQLGALIRHLATTRPTLGRPVVTGFSQGGVLSFALAARHPDLISAAVPVAGWLPDGFAPVGPSDRLPPVRALHGGDDYPESAREAVAFLREHAYPAELQVFPGVGHFPSGDMKAQWLNAVEAVLRSQGESGPASGARQGTDG